MMDDSIENYASGWIRLYRSSMSNWLWTDTKVKSKFEAWIYLILKAKYAKGKQLVGYDLIELERGQLLTSQETLAKEWRWNRSGVKAFLETLKKDKMVSLDTTPKYTKITICNYDSYQDVPPSTQQQLNSNSTATQQQLNIYKKEKKVKEREEGKEVIELPWIEEEFKTAWGKWKEYKQKEKNQKYKTALSENAALKDLKEISGGDYRVAIKIIDKSIAKQWQGLFTLKEEQNGNQLFSQSTGRVPKAEIKDWNEFLKDDK